MQETQKLMIDFPEYPNVLIKQLNHAIKEPHSHLAVFVMQVDGHARLDFIQVRYFVVYHISIIYRYYYHSTILLYRVSTSRLDA